VRNSPAYGARNASMVAAGTGETLPDPVTCGNCRRSVASHNRWPGKWMAGRVGVGGGRSTG
jgi:hypothetical protein